MPRTEDTTTTTAAESALILGPPVMGPAGALPPKDWAIGAICASSSGPLVIVDTASRDDVIALLFGTGIHTFERRELRLELTAGPLDFGTRALLALVSPETPQPLCAPGWGRHNGSGLWALSTSGRFLRASSVRHADEPCPRKALALALASVAS